MARIGAQELSVNVGAPRSESNGKWQWSYLMLSRGGTSTRDATKTPIYPGHCPAKNDILGDLPLVSTHARTVDDNIENDALKPGDCRLAFSWAHPAVALQHVALLRRVTATVPAEVGHPDARLGWLRKSAVSPRPRGPTEGFDR